MPRAHIRPTINERHGNKGMGKEITPIPFLFRQFGLYLPI
ncbi:hypothetical protein HMPREF9442_03269 [Paraprevotella xylaniphila YIT 11841]|uniref:Uncharacterized protein n=1 Tax=Paraprevotella xylaniphila YIT 11841 TaxID=762982 RepID=F3QYH5_9BACT|nr:hypothetical protein HMPREF9442_03269 [Paraprevotella xylaniphila YIT 11841]